MTLHATPAKTNPRGWLLLHVLLVALVCSLPHWVAFVVNRGDYSPFSVSPAVSALTFDENHAYAPPARRFLETGSLRAETDNYERRDQSAGIPFIPTAILGGLGRWTGSLARAFILADCFFPALLFLLFYRITASLIQDRLPRLLVAWATILVPFNLLNTFWLGEDALVAPLEITRTPQPEISLLILLAAAVLLGRALGSPHRWRFTVAAGIASGAVVYCYYFYAIAWALTLCLLFLLGSFLKKAHLWQAAGTAALLMVLLAIPYAVASARGGAQGGQTYLLERMGAFTHRPDFLPLLAGFVLTFLLAKFGAGFSSKQPVYFILTLLVAGALWGMNAQILTGFETQRWHFWKRLALPLCFFVLSSLTASVVDLRKHRLITGVLLVLLILNTAARLCVAGMRIAPHQKASAPAQMLFAWVRSHISPGVVIGTIDPELILYIPALTNDYTYVPSGLRSLTSTAEIVDRFDELACSLHLSADDVARETAIPNHLAHSTELLQVLGLSYTGDPRAFEWFVKQYRSYLLRCKRPSRRLDYVIVGAGSTANARFKQVYANSDYRLLQVRSQ